MLLAGPNGSVVPVSSEESSASPSANPMVQLMQALSRGPGAKAEESAAREPAEKPQGAGQKVMLLAGPNGSVVPVSSEDGSAGPSANPMVQLMQALSRGPGAKADESAAREPAEKPQ